MKIRLNALRVNAGMSQEEAARAVGVAKNTLIKWENYVTFPTAPQLIKLSKMYGCSLDDIFIPEVLTKSE